MRLGIMQPYFAPALGYFDLIHLCDEWIVFDTAQYRRRSWMNRNRILHPSEGWQYITAKVAKHPRDTRIADISLAADPDWRGLILRQLGHYRKTAPYYDVALGLMSEVLAAPVSTLARLDVLFLERACALLGIPFSCRYFSEMDLSLGPIAGPGDWALRISEALGADEYVNPPGGEAIFDREAFERSGIRLRIRHFPDLEYAPRGYEYVPTLSLVDVLMWSSAEAVRRYLDDQKRAFLED